MKTIDPTSPNLELLRQGDTDAFADLVRHHQTLILALAQSMGFTGADLDDAAMEVFSAVFLALPKFEGRSTLQTWLYRIAIRTLGRLRQQRKREPALRVDEQTPEPARPAPSTRLEEAERRQKLWEAVASLDSRSAAAVELFYRQGWSISQIGGVLECPEGTVKTLLHRAREQLRQIVRPEECSP